MEAVKHWRCNSIATGEDCFDLPIERDMTEHGGNPVPCVRSFWVPTTKELQALNEGGHIMIETLGDVVQPVMLGVLYD